MKKQLIKHLFQFTAAMSLCAAVLVVTPSGTIPKPGTEGIIPQVSTDEPGTEKGSENNPEISPQDDRELEEVREK